MTRIQNHSKGMRHRYTILALALITIWSGSAPAATLALKQWEVSLGGSDDDYATAIVQTSDGGYLVAGSSKSGVSSTKTSGSNGDYDAWVVRLDASGQRVWDRSVGGSGTDNTYANAMLLTSDDGCVVGGSFNNTDAWAVRLDANGNVVWDNKYGGRGAILCIAAASDGGFIVGASTEAATPGKTSPFYGGSDYWVLKLDAAGNKLWENSFGGTEADYPYAIVTSTDGGYLIGGFSYSDISGNKTSLSYGEGDFWLVKLDANGNKLWDKSYGGSLSERLYSIAPTADGGYLLGGLAATVVSPDPPVDGLGEYWVLKVDSVGNVLWEKLFGGDQHELLSRITPGADGTFLLSGTSFSGVSGTKTSPNRSSTGFSADYWVVNIDPNGNKLWEESFGGEGREDLFSTTSTSDGGYALAGARGSDIRPNFGNGDYWVLKINAEPCGTPLTISCPGDWVLDTDAGHCSAVVHFSATSSGGSGNPTVTCTPASGSAFALGTTVVDCAASDSAGQTASCSFTVTVQNPGPTVAIVAPSAGAVYAVGTPVSFSGAFTDNAGDTHTAQWMFDSISQAGIVNEAAGSVSATHSFAAAGVYSVTLSVNDTCGNTATADTVAGLPAMVVVFDPNGGYVTGGGWFNSPAGAYVANASLTGKASFGFVSKYHKGASIPTGETEFRFQVANLNFHSISYEWLVIAGAHAQYKGSGTVNNCGDYSFLLTATDGQKPGGAGQDKFRIKIWDKASNAVVYDNQHGASDSEDPTTALGGGSIVIHKD